MADHDDPRSAAARALAARLAATPWELDAETPDPPPEPEPAETPDAPAADSPKGRLFPRAVAAADPPALDRLVEALLFAAGTPLTPELAAQTVRGLTPERLRDVVADLNHAYRRQARPYTIGTQAQGYVLELRKDYQDVADKLLHGPREARLSQAALDTLSVVAYRQPVTKHDVDALRGTDSASPLRQLIRLGLIAHSRAAAGYATTARFLDLMGLDTLADLPRLADER